MNRKSFIANSLMALAISMLPKSLLPVSSEIFKDERKYYNSYTDEKGCVHMAGFGSCGSIDEKGFTRWKYSYRIRFYDDEITGERKEEKYNFRYKD